MYLVGRLIRLSPILLVLALVACRTVTVAVTPDVAMPEGGTCVLIIHGAKSAPRFWADSLADGVRRAEPADTVVRAVDWSDAAAPYAGVSRRALRVGEQLVPQLVDYDEVVIIAHSAGSFAAHAIERELAGTGVRIKLILLDPFVAAGVLDWRYGRDEFGAYAEETWVYLNTDDGVPATNTPCRNALNFDVTGLWPAADRAEDLHAVPIRWLHWTVGLPPGAWVSEDGGFTVGYHSDSQAFSALPKGTLLAVRSSR